jgi:hypothetical protein
MAISSDVVLCSLVDPDRRFTGSYCLHHQGDPPDDSHQKISPNKLLWGGFSTLILQILNPSNQGSHVTVPLPSFRDAEIKAQSPRILYFNQHIHSEAATYRPDDGGSNLLCNVEQ